VAFCALVLGPALSALAGLDPDLVAWWALDEGQGTTAYDGSGKGNDATVQTGATWIEGKLDGGLKLGNSSYLKGPYIPLNNRSFTIALWINPILTGASQVLVGQAQSGTANQSMHYRFGGDSSTDAPVRGVRMGFYSNDLDSPAQIFKDNTWYHVAFYYDYETQVRRIYVDGVKVAEGTGTAAYAGTSGDTTIGYWATDGGQIFTGSIDDVQIYHRALADSEITSIMLGLMDRSKAQNPVPEEETVDVPLDSVVSWEAGESAATHDVYLGTSFEDVNSASRSNPGDVLVSQGQTGLSFEPAGLEYGQTYYWRVDEVNAAPDNTIFKGDIWTFTAETFAYPVVPATVTASSFQAGMEPVNTVNGSGLSAADEHSTELKQMWMTTGTDKPDWIQYEFAGVEKLDEMWVWNSNQVLESFLGFGAKSVAVEYSLDGETWTTLEGVTEFAKATSAATYTHNTTVDFGGAMAKFVKISINNNWGGAIPQTGLSEVRFFAVPVQAFEPVPAVATTAVSVDTDLTWRPGREATSHQVYIGTDSNAVAEGAVTAATAAGHAYTPASLDFATTYYWKVDEVGDAGTYAGDVWNFTTEEYAVIDNFEAYNDDVDAETTIWQTWIDGVTTEASGSQVGYDESPFAEKSIIHGGIQAMPMMYDNTASPFYSEAEYAFDSPKNLTVSGAQNLRVYYRGVTPSFAANASGTILMNGIGADIWGTSDQFRFAYKTLTGNGSIVARVHSVYESNAWAKAGVMIRQNTDPGSPHAFMAMTPPSAANGASFQRRLAAAGDSTNTDATAEMGITKPYWVKVDRTGDKFSAFVSPDGAAWTQLGEPQTITMTGSVLIGLAVCSHDAAIVTGAEFSDVKTTGTVAGDWQVAEIGVAQREGNSAEPVYVTVKDSSGKSSTVVSEDAFATARAGWQEFAIPLSEFTSAGVKMNAVKSIVIGIGKKTAPTAGGMGIVYIDDLGFGTPLP
jgi:hypothetical protein